MNKLWIGIDPGKTGWLIGMNEKREIKESQLLGDCNWLCKELRRVKEEYDQLIIGLEKAQVLSFGGIAQGAVSIGSYMRAFGQIEGCLTALGLPFTLIPPKTWQKIMHAGTDSKKKAKDRSIEAAKRIHPNEDLRASTRCKVPHLGKVDALLICDYTIKTLSV